MDSYWLVSMGRSQRKQLHSSQLSSLHLHLLCGMATSAPLLTDASTSDDESPFEMIGKYAFSLQIYVHKFSSIVVLSVLNITILLSKMRPSDHIIDRKDRRDEENSEVAPQEKASDSIVSSKIVDQVTTEVNEIPKQAEAKDDASQKHAKKKRDHKMVRFKIVMFTNLRIAHNIRNVSDLV